MKAVQYSDWRNRTCKAFSNVWQIQYASHTHIWNVTLWYVQEFSSKQKYIKKHKRMIINILFFCCKKERNLYTRMENRSQCSWLLNRDCCWLMIVNALVFKTCLFPSFHTWLSVCMYITLALNTFHLIIFPQKFLLRNDLLNLSTSSC